MKDIDKNKKSLDLQNKIAIGLVIIYVVLLLPVLYIGRYNYHCADDFGFSAASHIAWEDTHSLLDVFQAAGETVANRWNTWQGTFTTMYLMAIEPGIFGDTFYHFVPWLMIGAMTASTMFMLYELLVNLCGCRKSTWVSMSMLYLICALECMLDPLQAFFWYNGATHYMIPHSLAMVLIGILIKARLTDKKLIVCAVACILSFLLGGSNFISALSTGVGLGYVIIACFFLKKKKMAIYIAPTLFYIPAFLINVLAPGNSVRQAAFPDHPGPIKAIMLAFYYCVQRALADWLDWRVLALILITAPIAIIVVSKVKEKYSFEFKCPLLVLIASFCFLSAMFAPTSYASGESIEGRVENIIFLNYLLLILLNEVYLIGWLDSRWHIDEKTYLLDEEKKDTKWMYIAIIFGILFCAGLTILKEENSFTSSAAVASLVRGEAARYGQETLDRTKLIGNCGGNMLEVPRFVETPYLLYMDDIVPDSDDWRNSSMERYYRIDEIRAYSLE